MNNSIFECPIFLILQRKTKPPKKYWINKNQEHNWHPFVYNALKVEFCRVMDKAYPIVGKIQTPIMVNYVVHYGRKCDFDVNNISSIVDKFFMDWLVTRGAIEDDCMRFVHGGSYYWGGYEKDVFKCTASVQTVAPLPESQNKPLTPRKALKQGNIA
jgi:hypothetical protein